MDWLAGADEWELEEAMVADRDSQNGILTAKLKILIKINCDQGYIFHAYFAQILNENDR